MATIVAVPVLRLRSPRRPVRDDSYQKYTQSLM